MNEASIDMILICTAEEGLNDIISRILEPKGFNLVSALKQKMIFSLIEMYCPKVIIADSGLSLIMGYTPFEIIRNIDRFKYIKVVMITQETSEDSNEEHKHFDSVIDVDSISTALLPTVCKYSSFSPDVHINEDARRLARAIVSDIIHYNPDAALRGAVDGTFHDILGKEIEKGREVYEQRVSINTPLLPDYFNEAIREFINKTQQCNLVLP